MTEVKQRNRASISDTGKTTFFIDNKIVSKEDYEKIMGKYTPPAKLVKPKEVSSCPFCKEEGSNLPNNRTKYISGVLIRLCDKHYSSKTTGEIAEILRK